MSNDDFPTAATSRARATGMANESVKVAMDAVKRTIQRAVEAGRVDCSHEHRWGWDVARTVVQLLTDKGYRATAEDDQREGSWISIHW